VNAEFRARNFTSKLLNQRQWIKHISYVIFDHGRNVVVKCGRTAWCETNIVIGLMQK